MRTADPKEAAYIVGYLAAIKQIRREMREEWDVDEILDRLEKAARRSAEKHDLILLDEQAAEAGEAEE